VLVVALFEVELLLGVSGGFALEAGLVSVGEGLFERGVRRRVRLVFGITGRRHVAWPQHLDGVGVEAVLLLEARDVLQGRLDGVLALAAVSLVLVGHAHTRVEGQAGPS
jgi:hypothetical protein